MGVEMPLTIGLQGHQTNYQALHRLALLCHMQHWCSLTKHSLW